MESALGIAGGHRDARDIVERWLDSVEPGDPERR